MGTGEFNAGVTLRWTSMLSKGSRTILALRATEAGITSGLMGHLARMQTLPYSYVSCKQFESPAWCCQTLCGKTCLSGNHYLSFSRHVTHKACTVFLQLVQSYASF